MPPRRELITLACGLVLGIVLFHRDWAHLFSSAPFFTDDYYDVYWNAYLLMLLLAPAALLISGGPVLYFWIALVFPSLLIRHAQFLLQMGPTNTWPPALLVDVAMTVPVLVACYVIMRARHVALKRFGARNEKAI